MTNNILHFTMSLNSRLFELFEKLLIIQLKRESRELMHYVSSKQVSIMIFL
jgi:hypothetical protein